MTRKPEWCAPGDTQDDVWLVRFEDRDMVDAVFIGKDAEEQGRRMWERLCGPGGTYNGYLFQLARTKP